VAGPAFAVVGAVEQPIDDAFISVGGGVLKKGVEFLASRGEAGEVEMDAAEEDFAGSFGLRRELKTAVFGGDERVDGIAVPTRLSNGGYRGPANGLKRPVLAGVALGLFVLWGRRSCGDPIVEGADLIGMERFSFRGHAVVGVGRAHAEEEGTGFGGCGMKDGAVFGALSGCSAGIEPETGFLLKGSVTGSAALLQEGTDIAGIVRTFGGDGEEGRRGEGDEERKGLESAQHATLG